MNENDNVSQNNNDEILNASFTSDTDEVMDTALLFIKSTKMINSLIKIETMRI